jgi:hypothetical protein
MIETSPLVLIECIKLPVGILKKLATLLTSKEYVNSRRFFLFSNLNYMAGDVKYREPATIPIIDYIQEKISALDVLSDRYMAECGIGLNLQGTCSIIGAKNRCKIDQVGKQIRVPIAGKTFVNGTELVIGNAYIMDNFSGVRMLTEPGSINLVFNYVCKSDPSKIWTLTQGISSSKMIVE